MDNKGVMKQFQIAYDGKKEFLKELKKFRQKWKNTSQIIFQIFSELIDEKAIKETGRAIEQVFSDHTWFGCSTCGNLADCRLYAGITVVATVFEKESSKFRVFQYDTHELLMEQITQKITEATEANPWVKAIELYLTIPEGSTTKFSEGLKDIRPDVHIFGGVEGNDDITSDISYVFCDGGEISTHSILTVFYGGEDFYVDSIKVTGWKPLGRKFKITKSEGTLLQELDGIPAYDVYNKYLDINNDENFFGRYYTVSCQEKREKQGCCSVRRTDNSQKRAAPNRAAFFHLL